MRLVSRAYEDGQPIPRRYTCDGENISPELSWQQADNDAKAFALILHDPDAPRQGGFTHWVLYDIPGDVTQLRENVPKKAQVPGVGTQGKNGDGEIGYTGPCPPSGTHRYFARIYALRKPLELEPGAEPEEVQRALEGNVIDEAQLMGTYERKRARSAF